MFDLKTPVENLYLVGPSRAKLLKKLEIRTLGDLLFYFPRNHVDLSRFSNIADIKPGEFVNIKARVLEIKSFRTKVRKLTLTHAVVEDDTASILVVWFNQPFLSKVIKSSETFVFSGKAVIVKNKLTLQNPIYEQEKQEQVHTARLVPIYWLTANITQKQLRSTIKTYLDKVNVPEFLPKNIIRLEKLLDEETAVRNFHFPAGYRQLVAAQKRLAFDEIFVTQLKVLRHRKLKQLISAYVIDQAKPVAEKIKELPFELTQSQKDALKDIFDDFRKPFPANRLLEGDVGSGKTIIAALALLAGAKSNFQAVLLAPTEVLAVQHYLNFIKLFGNDGIDIGLLTSSACKINGNMVLRPALLDKIKNGSLKIILGTHALIEPKIKFKKLAVLVIDEQHRFGVEQRSYLKERSNAHLISMSATPIPRTLALTLYGDLDISRLNQLPSGRMPIKTWLVPENKRTGAYDFIRKQITTGRQAFVICPLIDPSDKLGVKSATAEFEKLSQQVFPDLKIGLLHGKLKSDEKEAVMRKFSDNEYQILVSTSVVEVGVDVPNATVMMIEGAQRFGLAQLHQFRGRVGRSEHQSFCLLFSDDPQAVLNPRLQAIISNNNGFELAEKDLKIRGSGNLYGTEQSGWSFRIANLSNIDLVMQSRKYAQDLLDEDKDLDKYPLLAEKIKQQPIVHLE